VKVIDSSSLLKFLNREDGWEDVDEELEAGCITIELAIKEAGNGLWKRVKRGEITGNVASKLYNTFLEHLPIKLAEQKELYSDSMELAISNRMTLYDAMFIQLARKLGLPLVTSDREQTDICKKLGVQVRHIT
jgi:predicted nucleic acid-binding protein